MKTFHQVASLGWAVIAFMLFAMGLGPGGPEWTEGGLALALSYLNELMSRTCQPC